MINHPLTKLGTKHSKIVQNLVHEIVQKNGPKNSPMVQGSNGPVHIYPMPYEAVSFDSLFGRISRIVKVEIFSVISRTRNRLYTHTETC